MAAIAISMPATAFAASLLTFDGPTAPLTPYVEDGYKVDDGGYNFVVTGNALDFDIVTGPNSDTRTFEREDGEKFDVHQLDIVSGYPNSKGGLTGEPADDVQFEGYDENGDLIASATASSQFGNAVYTFGEDFSGLSELVIKGRDMGNWDLLAYNDVHFSIDDVLVSLEGEGDDPVLSAPLPATGILLAFAMLGVGAAARRHS